MAAWKCEAKQMPRVIEMPGNTMKSGVETENCKMQTNMKLSMVAIRPVPMLSLGITILYLSGTGWLRAVEQAVPERGAVCTVPASRWEDALLSGNGRMGVMMFGRPADETIVVNHWRLWMPQGSREIVPDLGKLLPEIKDKGLKEGPGAVHGFMSAKAREQGFKFVQTDPYHPAFLLNLKMSGLSGEMKNYLMTEDFHSGELAVRWTDDRGDWERKLFVSRTDNAVVMLVTGPKGQVGFELGMDINHPLLKPEISADNGWLTSHVVYLKGKGGYDNVIRLVANGGKVESGKDKLTLTGSDSALIFMRVEPWRAPLPESLSEAWDYSAKNPAFAAGYKTNLVNETKVALAQLPADYPLLLKAHENVHGEMFARSSLDLAGGADRKETSEKLMARAAESDKMPAALTERMYDACRYLIICSSGEAVPNLQGIWTGTWSPAWSGDWTIDTNLQLEMNSMLSANLPEMMEAYFQLVESWLPDCRLNAKKLYGCRGMVTNARSSNTCLMLHWVDWVGETFIAGGGWCAHYFYDYYLHTGDMDFLKNRCVPLLKDVALFYEDILSGTEGPDGKYRFWLCYSPELELAPNATFDIAVARETFANLIAACEELHIEADNMPRWRAVLAKMPVYQIGSDGALKEWSLDGSQNGGNYNHRHYSPMYPVFQSYEFSKESTPELWKAAGVFLDKKAEHWLKGANPDSNNITHGMMNHGQSAARLGRGDVVNEVLSRMATRKYLLPSMMIAYWPNRGGFGFDPVGTIPDMIHNSLLFSWQGTLDLLPALPAAWPKGNIRGILARGQIKIDELSWDIATGKIRLALVSGKSQTIAVRLPKLWVIEEFGCKGAAILDAGAGANSRQITLEVGKPVVLEIDFRIQAGL